MLSHVWPSVQDAARGVAGAIDAHMPSAVPRWVWAGCTVVVALVVGRLGGRVLAGLMQLALLAAALLVAWQMVQGPARVSGHIPRACVLEGTCGALSPSTSPAGTPHAAASAHL